MTSAQEAEASQLLVDKVGGFPWGVEGQNWAAPAGRPDMRSRASCKEGMVPAVLRNLNLTVYPMSHPMCVGSGLLAGFVINKVVRISRK